MNKSLEKALEKSIEKMCEPHCDNPSCVCPTHPKLTDNMVEDLAYWGIKNLDTYTLSRIKFILEDYLDKQKRQIFDKVIESLPSKVVCNYCGKEIDDNDTHYEQILCNNCDKYSDARIEDIGRNEYRYEAIKSINKLQNEIL